MNGLSRWQWAATVLLSLALLGVGPLAAENARLHRRLHQCMNQITDQQLRLDYLEERVEGQSRQIRSNAVYLPYLEERLAVYEGGTPADWREFAHRREARKLRENAIRSERATVEGLRRSGVREY